ncbi:MAG: hypothetical protein PHH51_00735 [Bacilli bacterium]|nr:hypothetical protein [Bacilli bacterium]MDD3896118.1 hypothetical protein [Bacilli bacterium]MDD4407501.1 hypothetical protein [Bacilli bacterium]
MKILKVIKKIVLGILAAIFFSFVIINTVLLLNINKYGVTQFGDLTIVPIKNKITSDKYQKGDIVIVEQRTLDNISVGNEIFVYKTQKTGAPIIDFGIVGEVHIEDEALSFENGATYSADLIVGAANKVYNDVGTIYNFFQSTWGFFFFILLPSFLIFIYELYAIITEIKYGREETLK